MSAGSPVLLENDLAGALPQYLVPAQRPSLAGAQAWCHTLTTTHYENFHVATFFLPKAVRPHFESVYAYCRVSDDLGDEVADAATGLRLLDRWGEMLDECYDHPERSRHPVFVALQPTIEACDLPRHLFSDLLRAFRLDQTQTYSRSWQQLIDYSEDSANPVGRLVLWICGYRDEPTALLSDKVCTALQLANFWQDVVEDRERGRRYIPADAMQRFGVTDESLIARECTPQFVALMQFLTSETRKMLQQGGEIVRHVDAELAVTLGLFCKGGHAILDAIEAQDYDVLKARPKVTKAKKLSLLGGAIWGKLTSNRRRAGATR